jgi:hypothetical protein
MWLDQLTISVRRRVDYKPIYSCPEELTNDYNFMLGITIYNNNDCEKKTNVHFKWKGLWYNNGKIMQLQ